MAGTNGFRLIKSKKRENKKFDLLIFAAKKKINIKVMFIDNKLYNFCKFHLI